MKLEAHGLAVLAPAGWEARIERRTAATADEVTAPVVHAATFPLPAVRGDYGSGAVEAMGPDDVFIALLEFGLDDAGSSLFPERPMPRVVDPDRFATNQLQRWLPGQAGQQLFFTDGGRAFCLYIVIGSFTRRIALAERAEQLIGRIVIDAVGPEGAL